jgi:hypothetical protein
MRSAWVVVLSLAAACSGAKQGSATIGQPGGTVSAGDTTVTVPAGAVTGNTSFTVTSSDSAPAPSGATIVGTPYVLGPEGTQFTTPVVVKLGVDLSKLPSGKTINDVVIYTAPVGSTSYTTLTTTVADSSHVQASTTHFSVFLPGVGTGCVVVCTMGQSESCSVGGGCTPGPVECNCSTQCQDDGTPGSCSSGTSSGGDTGGTGGTGGTPDGGGTPAMCTGSAYAFHCEGTSCVCQKDATVMSNPAFSCSATSTPSAIFAAYQACGYPGSLQTSSPTPPNDGGTTDTVDAGAPTMTGGGCMGGGAPCTPCSVTCPIGQTPTCTPGGVMNNTCVTQPTCTCQ